MGRVTKDPEELRKQVRKAEIREMLGELGNYRIKEASEIGELFKGMVSVLLENGLEAGLEDEVGYSKYDYKNRETDNYRNGHSKKTLKTSLEMRK